MSDKNFSKLNFCYRSGTCPCGFSTRKTILVCSRYTLRWKRVTIKIYSPTLWKNVGQLLLLTPANQSKILFLTTNALLMKRWISPMKRQEKVGYFSHLLFHYFHLSMQYFHRCAAFPLSTAISSHFGKFLKFKAKLSL